MIDRETRQRREKEGDALARRLKKRGLPASWRVYYDTNDYERKNEREAWAFNNGIVGYRAVYDAATGDLLSVADDHNWKGTNYSDSIYQYL